MNIINPATYQQPEPEPQSRRIWWIGGVAAFFVLVLINYIRPLPAATATVSVQGLAATKQPAIDWPATGQAAIAAPGYGVIATHGKQPPLATASIAKVITALCVLEKKPLDVGESGPTYTIGADDIALYNKYAAGNSSVAAVTLGEKLTEYQALQALMIPSADNIADSLAAWVFGSLGKYRAYAGNYLANRGISQTVIGSDASGYAPSTTSTANDLAQIGLLALKSPVLMSIAKQPNAVLPVAGLVQNYNTVLGTSGITGLKTGNNDADKGVFVFTADTPVDGKVVQIAGSVMGANDLQSALDASVKLVASLQKGFTHSIVAKAGTRVGTMQTAWGAHEPIVAGQELGVVRWRDTAVKETHTLRPSLQAGPIGSMQLTAPGAASKTTLQLKHNIPGPGFWWRLIRI
jgi:D-alanyl-D-alanine carboxypeptidase (penicillin-binding protein 5/6)